MWTLKFITEENFKKHISETIQHYGENLQSFNLERFNNNIIDPIKLIFDKTIYHYSWEEIIKNEIFRQRDKASNNDIGYFHQRIFQYIVGCSVPSKGWDVIYEPVNVNNEIEISDDDFVKKIFIEMKNKHNTMNSSASAKTYMKMQAKLLSDDECACFLVEAIAKKSQNITWNISLDGIKQKHKRIRRVSIDKFYEIVTGEPDAFYQMCMILPETIETVIKDNKILSMPKDTVLKELQEKNNSFIMALYMLGFGSYKGFSE